MRKILTFLLAMMASMSAFASKTDVPSDAVLGYEPGKVGVCIYIPGDMACFDVVFVGTYNNWGRGEGTRESAANCAKFEPVEGYDGWYYVAVEDATESPEGKPVMLDIDGNFNWDYQVGAATAIRGGVSILAGGFPGEIDLKNYGKDAVNVYTVDSWKSNPCTAVYHNYTITVISDGCDGFAVPFLVGGMTNWSFVQMTLNLDKTLELGIAVYSYSFKAAEGTPFQITSGLMDAEGAISDQPGWKDIAYIQQLVNNKWVRMPGEDGDNILTHENAEIVFDLRDADLRWARCNGEVAENVLVRLNAPAGAPESVEIIGSFDGWTGTAMLKENGLWAAIVEANGDDAFKFRTGIGEDSDTKWSNQIQEFRDGNWEDMTNLVFKEHWIQGEGELADYKVVDLDFSNGALYKWHISSSPITYTLNVTCDAEQGIIKGESGTFESLSEHTFEAVANDGYHFTQWSDGNTNNPRNIILTQNTVLTAEFEINKYQVWFYGFNNELIDQQSVEHGKAAVAPQTPVIDNYVFVGWDRDFSNVTSDLIVTAIYQDSSVPTDAVLGYEPGKVGVCIYIPGDMACFDVVFVGTYNNWGRGEGTRESAANCAKFEPVEGYDGWYYVAVEDATESPEGKPVMLDVDGNFNWSYQISTATKIRGGVSIVAGGVAGEIDLKTYGKDAVNVYTVDSWKSNPCTAIYHNYTITVISDGCDGFAVPFLVGGMTNWSFVQMTLNLDKTLELGIAVYSYSFKAAEGTPFQITSGLMDAKGAISDQPGWNNDSYLQKLVDGKWVRMPGEDSQNNLYTHENVEIVIDLREEDLRWARCNGEVAENVLVRLKAPAGAPESVEIIGSFDGWTGSAMTLNGGVWEAIVSAKPSALFKFRSGVGEDSDTKWSNQIQVLQDGKWEDIANMIFQDNWVQGEGDFADYKVVDLDFSNGALYKWHLSSSPITYTLNVTCDAEQGIIKGESGTFEYLSEHTFEAVANDGYHFTQWSDGNTNNPRTITVTHDSVLTAEFDINKYQVWFYGLNNELIDQQSIEHGKAAVAPEDPVIEYYDFAGWDQDFSNVTSDLIVTAIYEEGQTIEMPLIFTQSTDGSEFKREKITFKLSKAPEIEGFTFVNWMVVAGELKDAIEIQAIYQYNGSDPTLAPAILANPSNPSQKLIRNGNVYILKSDRMYTLTGQEVR